MFSGYIFFSYINAGYKEDLKELTKGVTGTIAHDFKLRLLKMSERSNDWINQAIRDLEKANMDLKWEYYEWACFTSQQAAEKAVKALFQYIHADAWGHSVSKLLKALPNEIEVVEELIEEAILLDRFYIPTRFPSGFDMGIPKDYFTRRDAESACNAAEKIIEFCKSKIY